MSKSFLIITIVIIVAGSGIYYHFSSGQFYIPSGETVSLGGLENQNILGERDVVTVDNKIKNEIIREEMIKNSGRGQSKREIFITDGVRHSIPLEEIRSGGPPKDGIPSIDNPKFVAAENGDVFLREDEVGLGVIFSGEPRFYPYQILVWHEIVNDVISGEPILVTYCPLCRTGVVFERRVNGVSQEFGVSGRLWQSNLLMYNRAGTPDNESLWSQVLGEAVLGVETGERLRIIPADTVRYGDWKKIHPSTLVLSHDTGAIRTYGRDPYSDYYSNETVDFGASFNDDRLHPKTFVLGIEIDGRYKAYDKEEIQVGVTHDSFAGYDIRIEKDVASKIRIWKDGDKEPLEVISGFWFSWLAVHPNTELYNK